MAQETLDRRLSAIEGRAGNLETKVGEMDEAIYRIDRNLIGGQVMFERIAAAMNISMVTEREIDDIREEKS